ncbi:MAG TPA: 2Fe-2S iron-sulfur cluster binding domain-containing protein [Planctomycetota bacterium]|nr:2Fe-2S iron-sulfur cluster binding domain-containing protein [Planctomycetota bacterium]
MLHRVHFRKENITATVPAGANLREVAMERGIDVYPLGGGRLSCHGKGFCGTCAVEVEPRDAVGFVEAHGLLGSIGLKAARGRMERYVKQARPDLVLSCQVQVKGDVIVTTQPGLQVNWQAHTYYSGRSYRSWEKVS